MEKVKVLLRSCVFFLVVCIFQFLFEFNEAAAVRKNKPKPDGLYWLLEHLVDRWGTAAGAQASGLLVIQPVLDPGAEQRRLLERNVWVRHTLPTKTNKNRTKVKYDETILIIFNTENPKRFKFWLYSHIICLSATFTSFKYGAMNITICLLENGIEIKIKM